MCVYLVPVWMQRLLGLSDSQMADTSYLRHLYLTRRALLAKKRSDLFASMHASSSHLPDPSDGAHSASDLAAKLRENAVEDYQVYVKISCAARRGVSDEILGCKAVQHAIPIVLCFELQVARANSSSSFPKQMRVSLLLLSTYPENDGTWEAL